MRLLVTVPWGELLGGSETNLQTVLDAPRKQEHEIDLAFLADGPWPRSLAASGHSVTVIDAGRLRQVHKWVTTVVRLAGLMHRRQPDIIANWTGKAQLYGAPAASLAQMGERNVWWQRGIANDGWEHRLATALPAVAIGCSSAYAATAQAQLRPQRPTFVVHPGARVDAEQTALPDLDLPEHAPVIGIVGRLQPWKGQDRLLRAHALLRDRGYKLHTFIVGGDAYGLSPAYAASLRPLIDELNLNREVTMTGQVEDARPYIRCMDILVNASDCEPFGIVLLEGMAAAVPVVAVNSGGPTEVIENGRTGILAPSGTPDGLADALEPLVASRELRRRIGQAGQERFMADFTAEMMADRFFAALGRLVNERH
jgi:glycosyltransferase involved in cell wall biosynthesis